MRRITTVGLAAFVVLAVLGAYAEGSPAVDNAIINTRIWNDDSDSVLSSTNSYPSELSIEDAALDGDGFAGEWANRHNFRLSEDGGVSEAVFNNGDFFAFSADVTITGTGDSQGGLNVSPWWSQDVDGVFQLDTATGEIAAFGGRLPFYSFTASQGLPYAKGDTVRLGVIYEPNSLSAADPATIEYQVTIGSTLYTSGPLAFDQGNPAEDPPYGLWGMLNDSRVGGFFMPLIEVGNPSNWGEIAFENMTYSAVIPEPAGLGLIGIALLAVRRRRT